METLSIRDLIKAGFHFGHRTSRWDPRMKPYIFKRRNLIHIIDLRETLRGLIIGRKLTEAIAAGGDYVLFVGTKKQARSLLMREAKHCAMPYVAERWPGGLLTNYVTIRRRLERLEELEDLEETGQLDMYSKKMVSSLRREKRKILRNLGGVRDMDRLPGLVVTVDPAREHIAVNEARKLRIPIIALTDTDANPENLDVVVPGNDDSIAAVEVFLQAISQAVMRGLAQRDGGPAPEASPEAEETAVEGAAEETAPEEAVPEGAAEETPAQEAEAEQRAAAETQEAEAAPEPAAEAGAAEPAAEAD